jgi:hypothetical protein
MSRHEVFSLAERRQITRLLEGHGNMRSLTAGKATSKRSA